MAIAYYSRTLPVPVDVVWDTIADFHGLAEWIERIVEVDAGGRRRPRRRRQRPAHHVDGWAGGRRAAGRL